MGQEPQPLRRLHAQPGARPGRCRGGAFASLRGPPRFDRDGAAHAARRLPSARQPLLRDRRKAHQRLRRNHRQYLGDGVFALFIPALSGPRHAVQAIDAARYLLEETDDSAGFPPEARPLPVGIGVHTGIAYVGVLGKAGDLLDFTALGDAVNVTQRLSSAAAAHELLISDEARRAAGLEEDPRARRELELRGIAGSVLAWSDRRTEPVISRRT